MLRSTTASLARAHQHQQRVLQLARSPQWRAFASDSYHEIKEPTREEEAATAPFRKKIHELKKYYPPMKTGKKGITIVSPRDVIVRRALPDSY